MDKERAMALLNQIIDYVSIAENTSNTIRELLRMGFEPEELVNDFNFDKDDVNNVLEDIN